MTWIRDDALEWRVTKLEWKTEFPTREVFMDELNRVINSNGYPNQVSDIKHLADVGNALLYLGMKR
jgi:predicted nucleotide-binding protein (sugar kinase/HSP70/actin superfamily)